MPGNYQYAEGGGPRPPYRESFLENIVGVSWTGGSGGVFVSGDVCCFERYVKIETFDSPQKWVGLGSMVFSDGGGTTASAYGLTHAGPIFLLGGHGPPGPVLMRSRDGKEWENVGAALLMADFNINYLVWDAEERLFYLQGDGTGTRPFYSPDGLAWYYSYGSFESHCKGPLKGVPDGVYGYDRHNDLIIAPGYVLGFNDPAVAIVGNQMFTVDVGLDNCICVAYVGGIWMAGGSAGSSRSVTTSSIDGGYTWFVSTEGAIGMHAEYAVATMVGGPIRDFK